MDPPETNYFEANSPLSNAVDLAIESELAADNAEDKIFAWLTIARVQSNLYDSTVVINSYLNAINLSAELPASKLKGMSIISKILIIIIH